MNRTDFHITLCKNGTCRPATQKRKNENRNEADSNCAHSGAVCLHCMIERIRIIFFIVANWRSWRYESHEYNIKYIYIVNAEQTQPESRESMLNLSIWANLCEFIVCETTQLMLIWNINLDDLMVNIWCRISHIYTRIRVAGCRWFYHGRDFVL